MTRLTRIEAEHGDAIDEAVDRFGDHEAVNRSRVLRWLAQFADSDLTIATKVLDHVRYYDAAKTRAMVRALVRIVRGEFRRIDPRRIVFVPVGKPGDSASIIARVLTHLTEGGRLRVVTM